MVRLSDKEPVYLELYEALAYFLGRQQLVIRAVIEQGVTPQDLQAGVAGWYDKTAQTGEWGYAWHFRFHGGGCELKHLQSGEPIDWIGPDPQSFSIHAFLYHLKWRLAQGHRLSLLRDRLETGGEQGIVSLIEELIAEGIISPERRLLPSEDSTQASAA
jgi:hypothetical protein